MELQSGGGRGGDPAADGEDGGGAPESDVPDGRDEGVASPPASPAAPPGSGAGSPAPSSGSSDGSFEVLSHSDAMSSAVDVDCALTSDSDRDGSIGRAGTESDASDASGRRRPASDDGDELGTAGRRTPGRRRRETVYGCLARLRREGSLYRGASQSVTTMTVSNGVFFYALHVVRRRLDGSPGRAPRTAAGRTLLASSVAGAVNVLLTNPLWVSSLRIMESDGPARPGRSPPTVWGTMRTIARDEGPGRLWSGTASSLLLVSNPIVQHAVYERLRGAVLGGRRGGSAARRGAAALSPLEAFVLGALAKAVATVVTYPLQ